MGNRTDGSPTIVAGNRLTAWNGYTLTYDYDGNLTHKQKTGFDQYLYWSSIGQLDTVITNGNLVSFGYDGFGRRVRKTVGTTVYKYVYDGSQILTIDSAGTRVRTYSYYPGVDQPHSMITNASLRYYYLSEIGAGHVWGIIDTTGTVVNRYRYAPFGLLEDSLETAPKAVSNAYRFTARDYDPETQLYFYRARYYDPSLARFVSEDPIGQNGGINQYVYASNNPINRSDHSGTEDSQDLGPYCPWPSQPDGSCHPGGGGGGPFGDVVGTVDLGHSTDFPVSWADLEATASPPHCSNFNAEQCAEMHSAIGKLQGDTEGAQCRKLGDNAAYRLYEGTIRYYSEAKGNTAGEYWSPATVRAVYHGFNPPEFDTQGLIVLYSLAFENGANYLFWVIAHEEAHAVFGLADAYDSQHVEIVDARNPASAMADACQTYSR